jgi:hypothetical protein
VADPARGRPRAAGDAAFQQVEADMFRMAALFVVERLKPWLLTYLAALLAGGRCDSPAPRAPRARRPERGAGCARSARCALRTRAASKALGLRPGQQGLLCSWLWACWCPHVQLQACCVPVCLRYSHALRADTDDDTAFSPSASLSGPGESQDLDASAYELVRQRPLRA